jgi:hypothetical protein
MIVGTPTSRHVFDMMRRIPTIVGRRRRGEMPDRYHRASTRRRLLLDAA